MLLLAENARQAFEGILGQTPTTPVITPAVTPTVTPIVTPAPTPTVTPTVTAEGLARDALTRSLTQYRAHFINRGVENPTARQSYIIEVPYVLYDAVLSYARNLITTSAGVSSALVSAARGLLEGLFQGLGYRRVGNLLAARRDDISARDLASIAVGKILTVYSSTLRAQGITSPTIRQASATRIGNTFDRMVSQARSDLAAPYYWKVGRLNYVVRNTTTLSAARNAVAEVLMGYNYLPGAPVPVTPVTPVVTPTPRAIITPIVTPIPTPVPTPIVTPVPTPVPTVIVSPPALVKPAPIDTAQIAASVTKLLQSLKIPGYPGAIKASLWDSIVEGAASQSLIDRYGVSDVWRAVRIEKTIPESEYTAAQAAAAAELRRRGYTKASASQESTWEPAAGVTPTTEVEYPYASPDELFEAALKYASAQMPITRGTSSQPTLLTTEECSQFRSLMTNFINTARGSYDAQRKAALDQISVIRTTVQGVPQIIDQFARMLRQRFLAVCMPPISPEDLVDRRPQYNEVMLQWRSYIANLPTKIIRTQLLGYRGEPQTQGQPLAVPPDRYDAYVTEAVEQSIMIWGQLPRKFKTREPNVADWRRVITEALTKAEIYRGTEAMPTTVAMRGEQITEEMIARAAALTLNNRIRNIGLPSGPLILHPNVWKNIVDTEATHTKSIVTQSTAYDLTHESDEELLARSRGSGNAIKAGILSQSLYNRIPEIVAGTFTEMGYYQGPAGVMAVNYATPAEFERIYPQNRAAILARAVDSALYGRGVSRNTVVSDSIFNALVETARRVAIRESEPFNYDYTIDETAQALRSVGVRPQSEVAPATPAVTPAVTPARRPPTSQSVIAGLTAALPTLDTTKIRYSRVNGRMYTHIDPDEYDRLLGEAFQATLEHYTRAGGDINQYTSQFWMNAIRRELADRNIYRSSTPIVATPALPAPTPAVTPAPRPVATPAVAVTPVVTPLVEPPMAQPEKILAEWAARARVFPTYEECREEGLRLTGFAPDRWQHCVCEDDVISQAVANTLDMFAYPTTFPANYPPLAPDMYDRMVEEAVAIGNKMIAQKTYTPIHRGKRLRIIT